MKHAIGGILFLAMILTGPGATWGDGAQPTEGQYRMGEIIVTGTAENGVEAAGTVRRITARDISDQGARTLDEALQLIPGVIVRVGADGTPRVDIRGFRTRHVQLFLNGIPVRDAYDGQFDPTRIPAQIIAEIKVTSGGGSVLYGAGGNGGAIDIITKTGRKGLHGNIAGEAGEGDRYLGKGSLSHSGEKADLFASVSVLDRDKFGLSDDFQETDEQDDDWRENSDRERINLFGTLGYQMTDRTRIGFTVSHVNGENGKPPVTNYDNSDPFTKRTRYDRVDDLQASLAQLGFSHKTDGPLDIRAWAYYSQAEMEENRYDDDTYSTQTRNGSSHQNSDTEIYGISAQAGYHIGEDGDITLGLNAEDNTWDVDGFRIRGGSERDISDDRSLQIYSAALEYEQAVGERAEFVLGYGHHFQQRKGDNDDNDFSYLAGITFDLTDSTRLRANHARKVRFPSIKQLYDGDSANPDLETEITYHYEAGIMQQLPADTTVEITGFIIDAKDFIEKDDSDLNRNYEDLNFNGVEFNLTTHPIKALMLRFGVTWLHTEDESDDSDRDDLQYRPEWTFTGECRYRFEFGLTTHASVKRINDQYFYDADDTPPLYRQKLDDFTVVDIKLSQQVAKTGLKIYAGVDNLFDENYGWSYGYPQPGRTIYGGVEYHF